MNRDRCNRCGARLVPSAIKRLDRICHACHYKTRVALLLSDEYIDETFTCVWSKALYRRLITFLEWHEIAIGTQARMLSKAALLFQTAEKLFDRPENMSGEWVERQIAQWKGKSSNAPTFFKAFFVEERIFSEPDKNEGRIKDLLSKLETIPQHYRSAIEVFVNERVALRERQIKLQAKHPLTMSTIDSDFHCLARLARWLMANMPDLTGWD